jgi:predicted TIM-barrel fold metal-dependent hydrolase
MIIDIHVHPVSRVLVRDPRHRAFMERNADCLAPDNAIDLLLKRMDRGGIDRACLMGPTHDDGIGLTNDDVRAIVTRHPDRFIGFVGVDPIAQAEASIRTDIVTAIRDWGFRGVGELGGVDPLDTRCDAIYRTCVELDVPLLVHTGIGLPRFLLKHGTPLVVEEVANRHPALKVVAAHAGVPWIPETIAVAARNENVWLDVSSLPKAHARAIDAVLSLALAHGLEDRVLFGSDYPVVDPAAYVRSVRRAGAPPLLRWLIGLPAITPEVRRKILGENAARLLKIDERPG